MAEAATKSLSGGTGGKTSFTSLKEVIGTIAGKERIERKGSPDPVNMDAGAAILLRLFFRDIADSDMQIASIIVKKNSVLSSNELLKRLVVSGASNATLTASFSMPAGKTVFSEAQSTPFNGTRISAIALMAMLCEGEFVQHNTNGRTTYSLSLPVVLPDQQSNS